MKFDLEKLKSTYQAVNFFFRLGLWRIRLDEIPPGRAWALRILRTFVLTVNGFQKDNCILRASALTFYTFLSIVPVLAMAFGIAKGFGFEPLLRKVLIENFIFQQEALTRIIEFSQELLEKTKGGIIAGIGVAILLWTVVKVLGHIEMSLNTIWNVKRSRSMGRKFNDYFAFMIICPLLVFLHSSLSVYITVRVKEIVQNVEIVGIFGPVIFTLLKLLPYALIWIILIYIYKSMPYTHVKMASAIISGILAGTIFQASQWGYLNFQVGVAQYNAIYGSFAAIPLFLIWLQVSWIIVLFGAEFSHAFENVDRFEFEPDTRNLSYSRKKLLYLAVTRLLTKNFSDANPPLSSVEISERIGIPASYVEKSLEDLVAAGLVSGAGTEENGVKRFQPAKDIRFYTICHVIDVMEKAGKDFVHQIENSGVQTLEKVFENFQKLLENSPENHHLKDI